MNHKQFLFIWEEYKFGPITSGNTINKYLIILFLKNTNINRKFISKIFFSKNLKGIYILKNGWRIILYQSNSWRTF